MTNPLIRKPHVHKITDFDEVLQMFGAKNQLLACKEDHYHTGYEIYAEQLSQIEFLGTKTHNKHARHL